MRRRDIKRPTPTRRRCHRSAVKHLHQSQHQQQRKGSGIQKATWATKLGFWRRRYR
jgi:hypothetical protein